MISYVNVDLQDRARGRVAFVTVDNAAKLNSVTSPLMQAFVEAINGLADDPDLRAVVLTGAGDKAFIGGANIDEMGALSDRQAARAFITRVHHCSDALRKLPVPVIARINGYCLGAGLEIAVSCDLRVAASGAVLGMPEVKLGVPSVIEAALIPRLTGWGRAREILLLGETFSAEEALEWGLVEKVVPLAELDAAVEDWLAKLMTAEPLAVRAQKALMRRWESLPIAEAVAAGIDAFEEVWTTDAPREAMAAFMAERAAHKARR